MLTVEIGRASKRDKKFSDAEAAMAYIKSWFDENTNRESVTAGAAVDDGEQAWHTHLCPECDQTWECDEEECPKGEYECPACHAETKGVEPPKDNPAIWSVTNAGGR